MDKVRLLLRSPRPLPKAAAIAPQEGRVRGRRRGRVGKIEDLVGQGFVGATAKICGGRSALQVRLDAGALVGGLRSFALARGRAAGADSVRRLSTSWRTAGPATCVGVRFCFG